MNYTSSEKSHSVLCNFPYDFGKKTGRKLWEAWVAATGTGSTKRPLPVSVRA
jgi:hypothetical protein